MGQPISVLQNLPSGFSAAMASEIASANLQWQANAYTGYTSSGYSSVSLMNQNGDDAEVIIKDCAQPQATPALKKLPTLADFLGKSGFSLMWVRLNKLEPGCCFWEHRDYSELDERDRVRLHIPITTTSDSRMVVENEAIHLGVDKLWYLKPNKTAHGFINGDSTRIHVIIDCYVDEKLSAMLQGAFLPKDSIVKLKMPELLFYEKIMQTAIKLYQQGQATKAEEMLLKTFLQYEQPTGFSHDLTIELYTKLNMPTLAQQRITRKQRYLFQEELSLVQQEFIDSKHSTGH